MGCIEVADTGCGISSENMTRILEPFLPRKRARNRLGLATVYGIVRQTGGYLHIQSTVGAGTVFTIYLPRLSESESVQDIKPKS